MKRIIICIVLLLLCLGCAASIILGEVFSVPALSTLTGIALGFIGPLYINILVEIIWNKQNWKLSERRFRKAKVLNKDTKIRISFAYLYRILIDGKYLLIKSSRKTGKFQPVGGVYKYSDFEKEHLKINYFIEPDDKIICDKTSENDYRFYVKDKYLRKFVNHFEKEIGHRENESDVSREFVEEIIKDYKIKTKNFGTLNYSFDARFIDFTYSSIYQCYELVLADIYDIKLTNNQVSLLQELIRNGNFILASAKDVETFGVNLSEGGNEEIISNHSWKILQSNSEKATYRYNDKRISVELSKVY